MANNTDNPKNPASALFKRLTRLFSGPIVNYRRQDIVRGKKRFYSNYGSRFTTPSGQQFKKTTYNPFDSLNSGYMINQIRAERYSDFQQMEFTPEIASALDIYADEMTTSNQLQPLITIDCPNEEIKSVLMTLYHQVLNIDFNLFGWSRTMCKYGDFFLYLDIDETAGVRNAIGLPSPEIERLEGEDPTNPNYVQYQWNAAGLTFENWQVAHFRILGHDKYAPYGSSVLEPSRRIWRQLTLLEDAMMSYRIVRAPERRVFYIDVGNIAPDDVEQYMQKAMTQMKRNQVVDPDTGRVDLRYNPMSVDEDYYLPVRGAGSSTRIETLAGGNNQGSIDDVKYLRDKLFSALKVPQSYLSRGEGADEDKTTLAQKDIRFARTIQRLQRSVVSELEKVGIVHLYTLGFRGEDLLTFHLKLNNPSQIAEMQHLESLRTKFDVAANATEGYFSRRWVAQNIFSLSDEEILRNEREMFYDRKFTSTLAKIEDDIAEGASGGIGGGAADDFGGAMGDEAGEGDEELEDLFDTEPEEEPEGDEDETLLAAPAKREPYTTPGAKGKMYTPVASDKRDMGARRRHIKGQYAGELASSTPRNLFKGLGDLTSLGKGISESQESIYKNREDKNEKRIFEVSREVEQLISNLERKKNDQKDKVSS